MYGDDPEELIERFFEALGRFDNSGSTADLDAAIDHGRAAVAAFPAGGDDWANASLLLSAPLHLRFRSTGSSAHLNEAIDVARAGMTAFSAGDAGEAECLRGIATMLHERYAQTHDRIDLDDSIDFGRRALAASGPDQPEWEWILHGLGAALSVRRSLGGVAEDLDDAVAVLDELLAVTALDHPQLDMRRCMLSSALRSRHLRSGADDDLDRAVALARAAADGNPPGDLDRALILQNLGEVQQSQHARTQDIDDLDEAIDALREAYALAGQPQVLVPLRNSLTTRWIGAGDPDALDEAIELARHLVALVPAGHPDRAVRLSHLLLTLRLRIEMSGSMPDIDEAVEVGTETAATLPDDHIDRGAVLGHLAAVHLARFERQGAPDDLEQAVNVGRAASALLPAKHPNRVGVLAGLCHALRVRYDHTGTWADIVAAVDTGREAVSAIGNDAARMAAVVNLAGALNGRFLGIGSLDDLAEVITLCRTGLAISLAAATPPIAMNRGILLSMLGEGLARRYVRVDQSGAIPDRAELAEAVAVCREAVAGTSPGEPMRGPFLMALGYVLRMWSRYADKTVLAEAVAVSRDVLAETPLGHPMRGQTMIDVAEVLRDRFLRTGDRADLEEAAEVAAEGVRLIAVENPARTDVLIILGDVLRTLWVETEDPSYAAAAIEVSREAAGLPTARTRMRIGAALDWGRVAAMIGAWETAADAYATAIELRPLMAWRGLDRSDREHLLDLAPELGGDAAACAIAAGQPDRALELLELARGVLWSQMLDTRADLTAIREAAPELATELERARSELDGPAAGPAFSAGERWDELVQRVRAVPGFGSFLLPPRASELRAAAAGGPVVIVNVSQWRCDALVVTTQATQVVPLPLLTTDQAWEQTRLYLAAAERMEQQPYSLAARIANDAAVTETLGWLWVAVAEPVLRALGHVDAPPEGQPWPRIWWCPCGPLALLPIHAAYPADSDGPGVLDRVVSSYTPTLRALIGARRARPGPEPDRLLVVTMPHTPGHPALPFVAGERDAVVAAFPGTGHTVLEDADATRASVHDALARHRWTHFSCHGWQDLRDPSTAGVVVHDGTITVADLTTGGRPGGEWAFLSACKTATGGLKNTDEVITLASAMVYTGWRHVIGTLWTVMDQAAAEIAAAVYRCLASDGRLRSDRAAVALHDAVRQVRSAVPGQPGVWAPFVHTGP